MRVEFQGNPRQVRHRGAGPECRERTAKRTPKSVLHHHCGTAGTYPASTRSRFGIGPFTLRSSHLDRMKTRFRLMARGARGGAFCCIDSLTGKRESLGTQDDYEASELVAFPAQVGVEEGVGGPNGHQVMTPDPPAGVQELFSHRAL